MAHSKSMDVSAQTAAANMFALPAEGLRQEFGELGYLFSLPLDQQRRVPRGSRGAGAGNGQWRQDHAGPTATTRQSPRCGPSSSRRRARVIVGRMHAPGRACMHGRGRMHLGRHACTGAGARRNGRAQGCARMRGSGARSQMHGTMASASGCAWVVPAFPPPAQRGRCAAKSPVLDKCEFLLGLAVRVLNMTEEAIGTPEVRRLNMLVEEVGALRLTCGDGRGTCQGVCRRAQQWTACATHVLRVACF